MIARQWTLNDPAAIFFMGKMSFRSWSLYHGHKGTSSASFLVDSARSLGGCGAIYRIVLLAGDAAVFLLAGDACTDEGGDIRPDIREVDVGLNSQGLGVCGKRPTFSLMLPHRRTLGLRSHRYHRFKNQLLALYLRFAFARNAAGAQVVAVATAERITVGQTLPVVRSRHLHAIETLNNFEHRVSGRLFLCLRRVLPRKIRHFSREGADGKKQYRQDTRTRN